MGFGSKWVKWIEYYIKIVRFSVGFCTSERGVRQCDPLSPFLFILAMEGFDSMMRIASQKRWIRGFQVGGRVGEEKEIGQLLYADDTLIFCEPVAEQISYIRVILVLFEAVSGLRVNWGNQQIQNLANILGCRVDQMPTTYLGMPLGSNHKALDNLGWYPGKE
ncbi:hypothetical protein MTR67_002859 [Solanum verrucosum]|uniref:Reverse transcriptase domain-containing protein n=1 Tax=Solanum verrucosum TaxID=315347 RepID=A0AAF0T970_SOLVR|nr:hypothetical protein MTR67_002859 [Solanum verrucosum]